MCVCAHGVCYTFQLLNLFLLSFAGLPHAHIVVWTIPDDKPRQDQIDDCVSAEVPDPEADPELHAIVSTKMVHGPCGALNPRAACMRDGACSKKFPKSFQRETVVPERGYPLYQRTAPEDGGFTTEPRRQRGADAHRLDSRWVVPYNPFLLRALKAHVNVEVISHSTACIKYVVKYVNKGTDQATYAVVWTDDGDLDEVTTYQHTRYLGSMEATWRILDLPLHEHHPTVDRLDLHLSDEDRRVQFRDDANLHAVLQHQKPSKLTAFFVLCATDAFAETLLYTEVPKYYAWHKTAAKWERRKKGTRHPTVRGIVVTDTLARIYTTTPRAGDLYYLRLLLMRVPGPTSFRDLRTVDGEVLPTMQQACSARGLLEDGLHWDRAMAEATTSQFPGCLRLLFAIILAEGGATCDPVRLWTAHQVAMSQDIVRRQEQLRADGRPHMSEEEVTHETLRRVGRCLQRLCGRTVGSFGLPEPPAAPQAADAEPEFDRHQLEAYVVDNEQRLTADQRVVYDEVVSRLANGTGGVIFLQAPGGCGKTFLENVLLAKVRSQGEAAVAVATSGIAACLLDGGTTAHFRFRIPLRLHADDNVCGISRRTPEAVLLQTCRLIVWDEAGMANRRAFEAVDRTLRDLRDPDEAFGGALTVLSGDWRQILPVVKNGGRAQVVDACLKSSPLWASITVMRLETNMRVQLHQDARAAEFSAFLLRVGNGELPIVREMGDDVINIPPEIRSPATSVAELAARVFPDLADNYENAEWLHQRAILTTRNTDATAVNDVITDMIPGAPSRYISVDTMTDPEAVPMPTEVLNSIELSGLPSHVLTLKVNISYCVM